MLDLSRQTKIIDSEALNLYKYTIFGIGNIGSWMALGLAKMGADNIEVWDFDKVEPENLAPQIYRLQDIGKLKTEALKEIIKENTGVEITTINEKITNSTNLEPDINNIYIMAVDTLEARRIIWDKLKSGISPVIDTRIGSIFYRIYVVNTIDETAKKDYEKEIAEGIPDSELECGEKGSAPINMLVVARVLRIIKDLVEKNPVYEKTIISSWGPNLNEEINVLNGGE